MTSPSRRKRPTTAPSTPATTIDRAPLAACAAFAAWALLAPWTLAADDAERPLALAARAKASPASVARSYAPLGAARLRWRAVRLDGAAPEETALRSAAPQPAAHVDRQVVQAAAQLGADEPGDALELGPADSELEMPAPAARRLPTLREDDLPDEPLPPAGSAAEDLPQAPSALGTSRGDGCDEYKADCRTAWEALRGTALAAIKLDIAVGGAEGADFPCNCLLGEETFQPRAWAPLTFTWKASGLCHKPLYFEDVHLERYGHSWNPLVQPVLSAAHFFVNVPLLPYHMGIDPPDECQYSLGYYRPGNCAPYLIDPIPLSVRGGLIQAGAIVGAAAIIP